jgi:CRP/FNR family transcriptional regulator, cyclic AMP receptor protein
MRDPVWLARDTRFKEVMEGDALSEFMRVCPERPYQRGEYLFHQGDPATHLHVVAKGQVKLVVPTATGHERVIAVVGPDDLIGEAFVLDSPVYRVDAVAISDAATCPMNQEQFTRLALHAPSFVLRFSEILATSLIGCRELLGHAFDPVKVRVAKVLLDQAERLGTTSDDGDRVALATGLRHEEIASLASATRVSASMAIGELREIGLVEGSRGQYHIDVAGLRAYTEDFA